MSEIHFRSVGPIGSGILTPEMVAELQAQMAARRCPIGWGSHACSLPVHAEGNHQCIDEDDEGEAHAEVDRDGYDEHGFKWDLYGGWDDE